MHEKDEGEVASHSLTIPANAAGHIKLINVLYNTNSYSLRVNRFSPASGASTVYDKACRLIVSPLRPR